MPHDSLRRARFVLRHEPELALSVLYGVEKLRPLASQTLTKSASSWLTCSRRLTTPPQWDSTRCSPCAFVAVNAHPHPLGYQPV